MVEKPGELNARLPMLLKPPTEAQLRESALRWQERVGPLLIDKWPTPLMALSVNTVFLEFPAKLADDWWRDELPGWSSTAEKFASEIDRACGWEQRFFRLNSRSPKDAPWPLQELITCSGKMMLHIMRSSERMLDDLVTFSRANVEPVLCLRDVLPGCNPSRELRVFVRDGRVQAVAEYGHEPTVPPQDDFSLRERAEHYVVDVLGPHLPLSTIVVDIFIDYDGGFRLIEVNPYGLSDPVGARSYERIEAGIPGIARHEIMVAETPTK